MIGVIGDCSLSFSIYGYVFDYVLALAKDKRMRTKHISLLRQGVVVMHKRLFGIAGILQEGTLLQWRLQCVVGLKRKEKTTVAIPTTRKCARPFAGT